MEGATAAENFAAEIGWEKERRERLGEARWLHLNVRVGLQYAGRPTVLSTHVRVPLNSSSVGQQKRVSAVMQTPLVRDEAAISMPRFQRRN